MKSRYRTNTRCPTRPLRRASGRPAPVPRHHTEATRRVWRLPAFAPFALAGLMLLALIVFLSTCMHTPSDQPNDGPYVSPYDWNGLTANGDRLAYYEGGALCSDLGVDVSDHQGDIDWQAVARDGIDFAIVRLGNRGYTEGALYADEQAAANLDGAAAAGLETGAYFFSQATTEDEAREEAEFALALLDGRSLRLPVVFDHEPVPDAAGRANRIMGDELTACARAFCERIEQAGYATMIYGNKQDIARFGSNAFGNRPVWFAEYDVAVPTGQFDFDLWQYTNGGSVAGYSHSRRSQHSVPGRPNSPSKQPRAPSTRSHRGIATHGVPHRGTPVPHRGSTPLYPPLRLSILPDNASKRSAANREERGNHGKRKDAGTVAQELPRNSGRRSRCACSQRVGRMRTAGSRRRQRTQRSIRCQRQLGRRIRRHRVRREPEMLSAVAAWHPMSTPRSPKKTTRTDLRNIKGD